MPSPKEPTEFRVVAPGEGPLGLNLVSPNPKLSADAAADAADAADCNAGNVVVTEVQPTSPLLSRVRPGDSLLKVDGLDVTRLSAGEVRGVLGLPSRRRFLVLHRPGVVGGASATAGDRGGAAPPPPAGEAAVAGTGTGRGGGGARAEPAKGKTAKAMTAKGKPAKGKTTLKKKTKAKAAPAEAQKPPPRKPNNKRWARRLSELRSFRDRHGHCYVPGPSTAGTLRSWIDRKRRERRVGDGSLDADRIAELDSLGFDWDDGRDDDGDLGDDDGMDDDGGTEEDEDGTMGGGGGGTVSLAWHRRVVVAERRRVRREMDGEMARLRRKLGGGSSAESVVLGSDDGEGRSMNKEEEEGEGEWRERLEEFKAIREASGDRNVPTGQPTTTTPESQPLPVATGTAASNTANAAQPPPSDDSTPEPSPDAPSPKEELIAEAFHLSFDGRPGEERAPRRAGNSPITILERPNPTAETRLRMVITALTLGYATAPTSTARDRVGRAACLLTAYDCGLPRRPKGSRMKAWIEEAGSAIFAGEGEGGIAGICANLPMGRKGGRYVDGVEADHPGYLSGMYRRARREGRTTWRDISEGMNRLSADAAESGPDLNMTVYILRDWFRSLSHAEQRALNKKVH